MFKTLGELYSYMSLEEEEMKNTYKPNLKCFNLKLIIHKEK